MPIRNLQKLNGDLHFPTRLFASTVLALVIPLLGGCGFFHLDKLSLRDESGLTSSTTTGTSDSSTTGTTTNTRGATGTTTGGTASTTTGGSTSTGTGGTTGTSTGGVTSTTTGGTTSTTTGGTGNVGCCFGTTANPNEGAVELSGLPDTTSSIGVFNDQLGGGGPYSSAVIHFIATHTAGTQKQLKADSDSYKAVNPKFLVLAYRLALSSNSGQYIINNQWASDWSTVNPHESWFLHNDNGGRHSSAGWDIHDVTNPDYINYWTSSTVQNMRATDSGGVFADSFAVGQWQYGITLPDIRFDPGLAGPAKWAQAQLGLGKVYDYPTGADWSRLMTNYTVAIETAFSQTPERFLYVPNIGFLSYPPGWHPDLAAIDGFMIEDGLEPGNTSFWLEAFANIVPFTAAGKFAILQFYPKSAAAVDFTFATYLLLKGSHTFVNLMGSGKLDCHYYKIFDLHVGAAVDPLTPQQGPAGILYQNVYRRRFLSKDGTLQYTVLVNPSTTSSYSVTLDGPSYQITQAGGGDVTDAGIDAGGNYIGGTLSISSTAVTSVTLAPGTAAFFQSPAN